MNLQLSGDPACFLGRKGFVQRGDRKGIKIVHDKYNLLFVKVVEVCKVFDFLCSVGCSVVFTDTYMTYATQRTHKHKYAAGTVLDIFRIYLLGILWTYWQWFSDFASKSPGQNLSIYFLRMYDIMRKCADAHALS